MDGSTLVRLQKTRNETHKILQASWWNSDSSRQILATRPGPPKSSWDPAILGQSRLVKNYHLARFMDLIMFNLFLKRCSSYAASGEPEAHLFFFPEKNNLIDTVQQEGR